VLWTGLLVFAGSSWKQPKPACVLDKCCAAGVIAVVTYGLYGAYTTYWDMDVHILESGAFDSFYESLAFLVNGIVFFYSGVSCVNFVVR